MSIRKFLFYSQYISGCRSFPSTEDYIFVIVFFLFTMIPFYLNCHSLSRVIVITGEKPLSDCSGLRVSNVYGCVHFKNILRTTLCNKLLQSIDFNRFS